MSKVPRCSPEPSTTMSRRNPVGGFEASARRSIQRTRWERSPRLEQQRLDVEALLGPVDGAAVEQDRGRDQDLVRRSGRDEPALDRPPPLADRAGREAPDAVTPWGSSRQPIDRMQSGDLVRDRMHVARAARKQLTVGCGAGSGWSAQAIPESTSEEGTASRRPWLPSASQANSTGGGPGRLDRELDHPPDQRVGNHRDDRADLGRAQVGPVQGDHRGIEPAGGLAQVVDVFGLGDRAAQHEWGVASPRRPGRCR